MTRLGWWIVHCLSLVFGYITASKKSSIFQSQNLTYYLCNVWVKASKKASDWLLRSWKVEKLKVVFFTVYVRHASGPIHSKHPIRYIYRFVHIWRIKVSPTYCTFLLWQHYHNTNFPQEGFKLGSLGLPAGLLPIEPPLLVLNLKTEKMIRGRKFHEREWT